MNIVRFLFPLWIQYYLIFVSLPIGAWVMQWPMPNQNIQQHKSTFHRQSTQKPIFIIVKQHLWNLSVKKSQIPCQNDVELNDTHWIYFNMYSEQSQPSNSHLVHIYIVVNGPVQNVKKNAQCPKRKKSRLNWFNWFHLVNNNVIKSDSIEWNYLIWFGFHFYWSNCAIVQI